MSEIMRAAIARAITRLTWACLSVLVGLSVAVAQEDPGRVVLPVALRAAADAGFTDIIESARRDGGLIVHLGCGDGVQTAALCAGDNCLVHGLDQDAANVDKARQNIRTAGLYGRVSVDRQAGPRLPYMDNLVRTLVVEDEGDVTMAEFVRVLCPAGVAYFRSDSSVSVERRFQDIVGDALEVRDDGWSKFIKPWPDEIDSWTHYLYDSTGNAVGKDTTVGPPQRFQWITGPRWARSHDHLATLSALVSAAGRVFYIVDEGPTASVAIPPQWMLVARDAFSGVLLWKRPVGPWEGHLRGFRTGPVDLARRLVAIEDRVYVTLGYGKPVTALDAATGKKMLEYDQTDGALEFIHHNGVLHVVVGDRVPDNTDGAAKPVNPRNIWHWWPIYEDVPPRKHLVAVQADSGEVLWTKADEEAAELLPATLAAADGRVFMQNYSQIVAMDALEGRLLWRADRKVNRRRPTWSAPTLVVYGDVVLSGDRAEDAEVPDSPDPDKRPQWLVNSRGGHAPAGRIVAFSVTTGQQLWESACRECYNAPVDVLVADGLVWSGNLVGRGEPGITQALDVRTGEVKRTRQADQNFFKIVMGHHRCYRNKATEDYLVLGRDGIELIDLESGQGHGNHWVRGSCQYGVMPANGLIYAPPHSCACHVESKLNGFNVLAPAAPADDKEDDSHDANSPDRLEKGPAYGMISPPLASGPRPAADWPTYRHDAGRSGCASTLVPPDMNPLWRTPLATGHLSSPVIAEGTLLVADIDAHAVHALDVDNGNPLWSYTAGGRVDSPPSIHDGAAIFGCGDGWIYCLRAQDGQLAWRFRAAPKDNRIVSHGQLESSWPLHGSVLVQDGVVHAVAGRSGYVDGGMVLCRLDVTTGEKLSETPITAAALPDILSSDGTSVFLRHRRFNMEGIEQSGAVPHLYSPAGFLDDSWWHRTYWIFGTGMRSGWGSWPDSGGRVPAGRLMVLDDSTIYGFGRFNQYHRDGSHVGLGRTRYVLYSTARSSAAATSAKGGRRGAAPPAAVASRWNRPLPLMARGMVLAGETLFVAGPPDVFSYDAEGVTDPYHIVSPEALAQQQAALEGKQGGLLVAISTTDGRTLAEQKLDAFPVWDGMAAARGRLFLSARDGSVRCFDGEDSR